MGYLAQQEGMRLLDQLLPWEEEAVVVEVLAVEVSEEVWQLPMLSFLTEQRHLRLLEALEQDLIMRLLLLCRFFHQQAVVAVVAQMQQPFSSGAMVVRLEHLRGQPLDEPHRRNPQASTLLRLCKLSALAPAVEALALLAKETRAAMVFTEAVAVEGHLAKMTKVALRKAATAATAL
jgi:hypothetical protein